MTEPRLGLILVGAGASRRMSGVDKFWAELAGRPIVRHSLDALARVVDACVLVVRPGTLRVTRSRLRDVSGITIVPGGAERQDSVRHGLEALGGVDIVAVHDVARPFATAELLRAGVRHLDGFDGAVPTVPVADTIKEVDEAGVSVVRTLDRSRLRAAQTPQVFQMDRLRAAHVSRLNVSISATDDAQLLELAGYRVCVFPGDPANFKITTPADLERARKSVLGLGQT